MEKTKKVDTAFGLGAIIILVITAFVLSDVSSKRVNEQKEYEANMSALLQRKNDKIRILSAQLAAKEQDIANLQKTLQDAKANLEVVNDKLVEPEPVPAPVMPAEIK